MRHESILIALIVGVNLLWLFVILPSNRGRGSASARREDAGTQFTLSSPSTGSTSYLLTTTEGLAWSGSRSYYVPIHPLLSRTGTQEQRKVPTKSSDLRDCSSRKTAPSWQTRSGSLRWTRSPGKWSILTGKHATDTPWQR